MKHFSALFCNCEVDKKRGRQKRGSREMWLQLRLAKACVTLLRWCDGVVSLLVTFPNRFLTR